MVFALDPCPRGQALGCIGTCFIKTLYLAIKTKTGSTPLIDLAPRLTERQ